MFVLSDNKPVSMGLQKMTVDYITMSKDPDLNKASIEDRLRNNTSGKSKGIYEKLYYIINKWCVENPKLNVEASEMLSLLIRKAEKTEDYDPDIQDMYLENYCISLWEYTRKSKASMYKEVNDDNLEHFVSDDDRNSDPNIKVSTEELLLKQGRYNEIDDMMTDQEARELLVESLDSMLKYEGFLMTTKENSLNALRVLQGRFAHQEYSDEQMRITKDDKLMDPQVFRVRQRKELIVTFGGSPSSNIKNVISRKLIEHLVSSKEGQGLLKVYRDFIQACDQLAIPFIELDSSEVLTRDYIQNLFLLLRHKNTVCVSEYDLQEFNCNIASSEIKEQYIQGNLESDGVPRARIPHYFTPDIMKEIYRVKITDLRKLDSITQEIKHSHITYEKESIFAGKKELDKNIKDIKKESIPYKERLRRSRTVILTGLKMTESNDRVSVVPGPFSVKGLQIIKEATDAYFTQLMIDNPVLIQKFQRAIRETFIKPNNLISDGNGFLKEKTGEYFEVIGETFFDRNNDKSNKFIFNKWLVNERGFIVSKFVDADVQVDEYSRGYKAGKKFGFDYLIIKDLQKNVILNGYQEDK